MPDPEAMALQAAFQEERYQQIQRRSHARSEAVYERDRAVRLDRRQAVADVQQASVVEQRRLAQAADEEHRRLARVQAAIDEQQRADALAAVAERSARRAEELLLQQQIYENTVRYDYEQAMAADEEQQAALRRAVQYVRPAVLRQNYERDVRALQRAARREPDVPGSPAEAGIASRLGDGFAAALAWMRRRAAGPREEDEPDNRDDDSQQCTTCWVNKRAVICLPCGHCTQCNACFRRWKAAPDIEGNFHGATCPFCRELTVHTQQITQFQRDALSAGTGPVPQHAGSSQHRVPPGPIYMNATLTVPRPFSAARIFAARI